MPTETLAYTYTTEAEITRVWSQSGVDLRLDDLSAGEETTFWTELVAEATDEVNLYIEGMYAAVDAVSNRWVRRQATWIGCWLLSQRRGNPEQYSGMYERAIRDLERVRKGELLIPRLPMRGDLTPAMSNLKVDDRFNISKIRVQPTVSTGGSSSNQQISPDYPGEFY